MSKIDTVIFDLGGVLIDWRPLNVYLKAFGGDENKAQWFIDNICDSSWNAELDCGKSWDIALNEKINEFPEYEQYIKLYRNEWELMLHGEISGTVDIFKKLKSSGKYHLYSITNWSTETFSITWEKFDFLKWFEGISVSGNLKMIKPHKEIYLYTLEKYRINPGNSVFIDDNPANIKTANDLGINGILYKSPWQLEKALSDLNVKY
jgi:2-haloacid dehalogenase